MMRRFVGVIVALMLVSVWAFAAESPPILTVVLPQASYSIGSYAIGAQTVPLEYNVGFIRLSRGLWTDPTRQINWAIEISYDSGSTWTPLIAGSSVGGIVHGYCKPQPCIGPVIEYSEIGAPLAQPSNPNRRIRGTFEVSGGSVTTEVSARLESL
jgi:hypothetical protein